VLYTEVSCTLVFETLGIFWNLWPEINCRVALTKVSYSQSVSFLQQTSLWQTVGKLDSHHRQH